MWADLVLQQLGAGLQLRQRVSVSSGVTRQAATAVFLPRPEWRAPTSAEQGMLFARGAAPLRDSIAVLKADPRLRGTFWEEVAPAVLSDTSRVSPEDRQRRLWDFARLVTESLERAGCLRTLSLRSCDVQVTPPGQGSTAFDYQNGVYIGLHIDNHDHLPLSEKRNAFQLLCLNLGPVERYLHFINLAVPRLVAVLEPGEDGPSNQELIAAFFSRYPDYPIVRVTLPPDHAYIATTQYVIHDGATNHEGMPDVALLIAGHFDRRVE